MAGQEKHIIIMQHLQLQIKELSKQLELLEESYHFRNGRIIILEELTRQKDIEIQKVEELKK